AHAGAATPLQLQSPDGRNRVGFALDDEGTPTWTLARDGRTVIAPSPLGVRLAGDVQVGKPLRVVASRSAGADQRYERVAGKSREGRDHYRELEIDLAGADGH